MENNNTAGTEHSESSREKEEKQKKAVIGCFVGCLFFLLFIISIFIAIAFIETFLEDEPTPESASLAAQTPAWVDDAASEEAAGSAAQADGASEAAAYRADGNNGLPAWYPADPLHFPNFHGENLARVVDNADTLTPEQEKELTEQIENIVQKYNFGFVIFTDKSTHGFSMETYSVDFFLFNGYGLGDDFRGTVFFHSLEPGNRGWRTTSVGLAQQIFNYRVTNGLDDLIDSDIRAGRHYEAYKKYVAGVENIYHDYFVLPAWYLAGVNPHEGPVNLPDLPSSPDMSKEHLIDNAGIFNDAATRRAIEEKITDFIKKTGNDLVVFTDTSTHNIPIKQYGRDFYYFNGFSKDGYIFVVRKGQDDSSYSSAAVLIGRPAELCQDCDFSARIDRENGLSGSLESFMGLTSFFAENERLPIDQDLLILAFIISAFINLIVTIIIMTVIKRSMTVIVPADADSYLAAFNLRTHWSKYLYKSVSKTRRQKSSSGSRSSNGTSYSSSGRNY